MIKTVIADDERVIRNGLKKMLEASKLPISIEALASNGKEALEVIKDVMPQILLIDINMPGIKGLDVIEMAKTYIPNSKIIIISGHNDFEYVKRAMQLGVVDYLLKPINKRELIDVIKKVIDQLLDKSMVSNEEYYLEQSDNSNIIANKAIKYIKENFRQSNINLSSLSKMFHISESYMTRIIKKKANKSFSTYITDLRMEDSMKLLVSSDDIMIGQVAESVGYSSHHYFCRVFKGYTGLSPLEYKQKFRRKQ